MGSIFPVKEILLESWDRDTRILNSLATLITEENRKAKPSPDGMSLDEQLAHIHTVRQGWLHAISPEHEKVTENVYVQQGVHWVMIDDLQKIKDQVEISGQAIRQAMSDLIDSGATRVGPYEHPIFFLQHMVWHEGWHVGLIFLALRLNGQEPEEAWEERNVWGIWRDPEI